MLLINRTLTTTELCVNQQTRFIQYNAIVLKSKDKIPKGDKK